MRNQLKNRILVLDGAMGTMIQQYKLTETDHRGKRFENWTLQLKGNNDLLVLTQPEIIHSIHTQYLEAGADIIETNTFNAQAISMEDYGMSDFVRGINLEAARIARKLANEFTKANPSKPRFVAGSVGPTNKTASFSFNTNNSASRVVNFDELFLVFTEQMQALIEGGVDALLIETVFDTLNAKAALLAAKEAMKKTGRKVEIMLSATVDESSGHMLSGETMQDFLALVQHEDLLSIGLNCSFGAQHLKELAAYAPFFVSAHPNAGLPNEFGEYDESPQSMAIQLKKYIDEELINIVGGCCGTSPAHIAEFSLLVGNAPVRKPGNNMLKSD